MKKMAPQVGLEPYNPPVNSLAGCSKSNNFAAQMTTHGNTTVLEVANIVTLI